MKRVAKKRKISEKTNENERTEQLCLLCTKHRAELLTLEECTHTICFECLQCHVNQNVLEFPQHKEIPCPLRTCVHNISENIILFVLDPSLSHYYQYQEGIDTITEEKTPPLHLTFQRPPALLQKKTQITEDEDDIDTQPLDTPVITTETTEKPKTPPTITTLTNTCISPLITTEIPEEQEKTWRNNNKKQHSPLPKWLDYYTEERSLGEEERAVLQIIVNEELRAEKENLLCAQRLQQEEEEASKKKECGICADEYQIDGDDMYLIDCGHYFCRNCLEMHVEIKLKDNDINIRCPRPGCEHNLTVYEVKHLTPQLVAKWDQMALTKSLDMMDDAIRCPTPDCIGVVIRSDSKRIVREQVICPVCQADFCTLCKQQYHYASTCAQVIEFTKLQIERHRGRGKILKELEQRQKEIAASEKKINKDTTPCPKCLHPTIKESGCHFVVCSSCKSSFCWSCLALYSRHKEPGSHLDHGLYHIGPCYIKKRKARIQDLLERRTLAIGKHQGEALPERRTKDDICSVCHTPASFRCLHCPTFMLCTRCEISDTPLHPENHILMELSS